MLCTDLHLTGPTVGAYVRGMVDDRYSTDPGGGPCLQSRVLGTGVVSVRHGRLSSPRVTRLRDKLEGCKTVIIWSQAPRVCRSAS